MESEGLTAAIAGFAAGADALSVPPEAIAAARNALIDTVGCMLAGRREPPVSLLAATLPDAGQVATPVDDRRLAPRDAALLMGMAGHVLDFDDVGPHGHPSVAIVPALLAEAPGLGAPGGAVLRAAVIGYECWFELAGREPDAYHLGGWHPTAVLGVISATAALAALHGLDAGTARHALGLAASFAGGVIANFGTPVKPLHAGRAAAQAIEAVRLAQAGLTAAPDAFEHPHGLLMAISPRRRVDVARPVTIGQGAWQLLRQGLSVKRYPVCYASHRCVDAVIALAQAHDLRPGDVVAIEARLGAAPAATLRYLSPEDGLQARFSLNHNLAAALADRALGFAQLTDEWVRAHAALYPLTTTRIEQAECPEQPGMALHDFVTLRLRDGSSLDSGPIRYPRGHARQPLTDAELAAKFLDCARQGGVADGARMLDDLRASRFAF